MGGQACMQCVLENYANSLYDTLWNMLGSSSSADNNVANIIFFAAAHSWRKVGGACSNSWLAHPGCICELALDLRRK